MEGRRSFALAMMWMSLNLQTWVDVSHTEFRRKGSTCHDLISHLIAPFEKAFANFIRFDTCPTASTRCVNSALLASSAYLRIHILSDTSMTESFQVRDSSYQVPDSSYLSMCFPYVHYRMYMYCTGQDSPAVESWAPAPPYYLEDYVCRRSPLVEQDMLVKHKFQQSEFADP